MLSRQFENAIHQAKALVWNEEGLTRFEQEDLTEKLRKIEVAWANETITGNEALAKIGRLLKDTEIDFLELLINA